LFAKKIAACVLNHRLKVAQTKWHDKFKHEIAQPVLN